MDLETLGEGKSRTLSQLCTSSSSLPLILNIVAGLSQTALAFRSCTFSSLSVVTHPFLGHTSLPAYFWVTDLTSTTTGCKEWELGRGAIKKSCIYLKKLVWLKKRGTYKMTVNKIQDLADVVAALIQLAACWDRGSETLRNSDDLVLVTEEDPSSCCICVLTSCITIFQEIPFSQPQFQVLSFSTAAT